MYIVCCIGRGANVKICRGFLTYVTALICKLACFSLLVIMFNTSYTVSITNSIVGYVSSLLGGLFSVIYVAYSVDSTLYYNRQSYSTCNVWLVG
jgi:hypothetical protein